MNTGRGCIRNLAHLDLFSCKVGVFMTEQNRKYITKEIGKLLSDIWRIKGLVEQEYGPQHPITRKLSSMHGDAQALLQEKTGSDRR
jgi:hypothetical protein